ncbi:MAG TPA: sigma-70 family RNA polymerase sigma factor [Planctomycetota bacterium]|nr:sigma-70 family RNA polymerase sigma factor [Planctomycetota bacterium]
MRRIAGGDERALGILYDRHSATVFALSRRMLRDSLAAEELLGDVFCELWRRADRFDAGRGSALALLMTLCRSRGIDRLRSARAHGEVVLDDDAAVDGSVRAEAASPLAGVVADEERARVVGALGELAPEQRHALELAYYEGLSHSEVAQRLDRPLGTVKTWIRQGLIRLRDVLRIPQTGGGP